MIGLLAELERSFISGRTCAGVNAAQRSGFLASRKENALILNHQTASDVPAHERLRLGRLGLPPKMLATAIPRLKKE
jgi:DNA invertase Pin-like site-specific DNA recombinase